MNRKPLLCLFTALLPLLTPFAVDAVLAQEPSLGVVPPPRLAESVNGKMPITATSRIITAHAELSSVAKVVGGDINRLVGVKLTIAKESPSPGDIVLQLDPALHNEAYVIEVAETATIRAGNSAAVAQGTVTLLQTLAQTATGVAIPRMIVRDEPAVEYRGLMIDCARNWHSPKTLKQLVTLCRWYKIRYLHLHLTDDQSFTFPSTAMPDLSKGMHYSLDELRDLETFAHERGVTIVPELDIPGHATVMVQALPKVFATSPPTGNVICVGREETYKALDTLVGEMCDVFRTSPYFHIGADEVDNSPWKNCKDTLAYMAANNIESPDELYRHFIVRMNEIVKKHGKKTLVWEGFVKEGKTQIPRDVTVMVFECMYNLPPDLLADGYPIINTSWQPLYVTPSYRWTPEHIFGWNHYRWEHWFERSKAFGKPINAEPTALVVGSQLCSWEQAEGQELSSLRERLAAMSERIWNPTSGRSFADFSRRFQIADAGLEKLLREE